MGAHNNVSPHQFKLFMGGQEFQQATSHSYDLEYDDNTTSGRESMSHMWDRKLTESKVPSNGNDWWSRPHGAGVYDSLSAGGYDTAKHDTLDTAPTIYVGSRGRMTQGEGHHRIAAAADIERTTGRNVWLPVNYEKDD